MDVDTQQKVGKSTFFKIFHKKFDQIIAFIFVVLSFLLNLALQVTGNRFECNLLLIFSDKLKFQNPRIYEIYNSLRRNCKKLIPPFAIAAKTKRFLLVYAKKT